jgi:MoxR-like ATPase
MFNIVVDYPTLKEEEQILSATTKGDRPELQTVLSSKAIVNLQKLVESVPASDHVIKYVARLVRSTRPKDAQSPEIVRQLIDWGAGPRAGQSLILGGKAMAAMDGRFSVAIDDIKRVAIPVLRHRISTNFQASAEGISNEAIIQKLIDTTPEPEIPKYEKAKR